MNNNTLAWIALAISVFSGGMIAAFTRYDYFGGDSETKLKAFKKTANSAFICIGLAIAMSAKSLGLVSESSFNWLFFAGYIALGFKIIVGLVNKD